ncbi:hypothetical protein [Pseudidiomarina halophila]|uniref:hypothetical protein n=1 Tax=Pseudidiomarina halophila TaxID=1449799 RepID=UPI00360DAC88
MLGEEVARKLCPRFGLSAAETETVAWLVRWHLLMTMVAFKRDLNDPKTIADFANQVQSPERLRLLLVLTVVDIRAVGPKIWNGWKGQLLRDLYYNSEEYLLGGQIEGSHQHRIRETIADLRKVCPNGRIWNSKNLPINSMIVSGWRWTTLICCACRNRARSRRERRNPDHYHPV